MVEPLPLRRVEGKGLALPHPGVQAVNGLAFAEYLFHHRARLPHGGNGLRRQRDGLTMAGHRDK